MDLVTRGKASPSLHGPEFSSVGLAGSEALGNGSALHVREGESLRLVCAADSNPPAMLNWTRGRLTPQLSQSSTPGVLELPHVELGNHGKYVCRARNKLGSQEASVSLFVVGE